MKALRPPTDIAAPRSDDALRMLFSQRADDIPTAADMATVAVGQARRIVRRRTSIGGVAAVLAFVLTLGTAVSLRGWWLPEGSPGRGGGNGAAGLGAIELDPHATGQVIDYSPVMLRVDVVVGNRIWDSAAGKWLAAGGTEPDTVVRVPLGWLAGDDKGVRLVQYDGTTRPVATRPAAWTVSGDGSQIAILTGTTLSVRDVTGHGAVEVASTTVPEGETPIGFVASTVVLTTSTGKIDAWRPGGPLDGTDLEYVYTSSLSQTFGLVASPGSGRPCLARVVAGEQGVRKAAMAGCHDLLAQGVERAAVSPDGQHLAMPFDGGMWIINLARSVTAFQANPASPPVRVATCSSDGDATPVWQNDTTVVTSAHGALVSCGVDGIQRDVELPKDVNASARLVPSRVA